MVAPLKNILLCCAPKEGESDTPAPAHIAEKQKKPSVDSSDSDSTTMARVPSLAGKIALVTGASKGIGKATALALAAAGSSVVINFNSDEQAAKDLVGKIGADRALAVKADCSSLSGIDFLVKQTVNRFGRIDVLIANAGVLPMKDLEHTTEEDFDRTFTLNVKGPYFLAQVSDIENHVTSTSVD